MERTLINGIISAELNLIHPGRNLTVDVNHDNILICGDKPILNIMKYSGAIKLYDEFVKVSREPNAYGRYHDRVWCELNWISCLVGLLPLCIDEVNNSTDYETNKVINLISKNNIDVYMEDGYIDLYDDAIGDTALRFYDDPQCAKSLLDSYISVFY